VNAFWRISEDFTDPVEKEFCLGGKKENKHNSKQTKKQIKNINSINKHKHKHKQTKIPPGTSVSYSSSISIAGFAGIGFELLIKSIRHNRGMMCPS